MIDDNSLRRLAQSVSPSREESERLKQRISKRIHHPVARLAGVVNPSEAQRIRLKERISQRIRLKGVAASLPFLAGFQQPEPHVRERMRRAVLVRMDTARSSLFHVGLKWTAAFVLFAFIVQSLPRAFIAPTLKADNAVQLVPQGRVTVVMGGIEAMVETPQVLKGPTTIRTGDTEAVIMLNDDGQVRVAPHTSLRLNDLTDRPQVGVRPTLTLKSGKIWLLGMISPLSEPLSVQTSQGTVSVHDGSLSIIDERKQTTLVVLTRGVSIKRGKDEAYVVAGEEAFLHAGSPLSSSPIAAAVLRQPWISQNMALDGIQREKTLKDQERKRTEVAGILPSSSLYPLKRIAEAVDIALTPGESAKVQKRLQLAETRLNEAIALLGEGDTQGAQDSIAQYRQAVLDVAKEPGDNLVKYLIEKQVDEASASVAVATPNTDLFTLKQAVLDLSRSLPIAQVRPQDAEGYIFVDRLASLNESLTATKDLPSAITAYNQLQPYAQSILSDQGANPLLQREARSLLAKTSSLIAEISDDSEKDPSVLSVQKDIALYLPSEPARTHELVVTEDQINATVDKIVKDIFVYRMARSRYNVLMNAMDDLKGNANYGTILRRLERKLPQNGLAGYVKTRIVEYGQELRVAECRKDGCSGSGGSVAIGQSGQLP